MSFAKTTASGSRNLSVFSPPITSGSNRVFDNRAADIFAEIYALCSQRGWDGEDALPITLETVRIARRVQSDLHQFGRSLRTNISPGADGTIGFEMHNTGGTIRKVFIEARPDQLVRAYWVTSDDNFVDVDPTVPSSALHALRTALEALSGEGRGID